MLDTELNLIEKPAPLVGQVLTEEEYQEAMAERLSKEILQTKENGEKTASVISSFVQSYRNNKNEQPLDQWLIAEFKKYPDIWINEAEIHSTANEMIDAITRVNQAKSSFHAHLDHGNSQANWLAKEIEEGAAVKGVVNVGAYSGNIEQALEQANNNSWDAVTRQDGLISQALNLDGFIAEHHHADTFNIDAITKGSAYRAKVLVPESGEAYGKNSMDIGIYDGNGKLVQRYQSKYGADADSTANLFEKGDYRGQRKLVPKGHGQDILNSSEVIEIDGVSSKPLSKEEAKEFQNKAQNEKESKQYEWSDTNRIDIAKQIGKRALTGAYITAGMQGTRILARRIWNSLTGKANASVNEDLQEFFESSIKSTAHVGVQVAVSGGLVVAVKNGWLGTLLKSTPAGLIANIAYIGLENAKVLFKLNSGELTSDQALDAMGQTTTIAVTALAGAAKGGAFGASIGSVFGPVGAFVGGLVGGVAGGIAGSSIGQAVYDGGKAIVNAAVNTITNVASSIGNGVIAFRNVLSEIFG